MTKYLPIIDLEKEALKQGRQQQLLLLPTKRALKREYVLRKILFYLLPTINKYQLINFLCFRF